MSFLDGSPPPWYAPRGLLCHTRLPRGSSLPGRPATGERKEGLAVLTPVLLPPQSRADGLPLLGEWGGCEVSATLPWSDVAAIATSLGPNAETFDIVSSWLDTNLLCY